MNLFKDKLIQLPDGRNDRIVERDVLRISGLLHPGNENEPFESVKLETLRWVEQHYGGGLPDEAWRFEDFKIELAGRNTECFAESFDDVDVWALRSEDPDSNVPGRIWKTEVVLAKPRDLATRLSLRLRISSNAQDFNFVPSSPRLVREIVTQNSFLSGAARLKNEVNIINTEYDYDSFKEHLFSPKRKNPIIAFSHLPSNGPPKITPQTMSRRLVGMVHVYSISPGFSRKLSDDLGKALSVFDGGIRIYYPGFDASANSHEHRLFVRNVVERGDNFRTTEKVISHEIANYSLRRNRIGTEILSFADISSVLHKHRASKPLSAPKTNFNRSKNEEIISRLKEQISSLEKQVVEAKELEAIALEENDEFLNRAEEAEERARSLTAVVQSLRNRELVKGEQETPLDNPPDDWGDFSDWVEENYSGLVILTGKAKKEIKKSVYGGIFTACRAINWLAERGIESRKSGAEESTRDAHVCDGVIHAHCGGDAYDFDWEGRRYSADWHIKSAGNTRDPVRCLRIYFAWNPETQQIIVSHMPSHRRTSMS